MGNAILAWPRYILVVGNVDELDWMSATELAANQFPMTQMRDKLTCKGIRNQTQVIQAHEQVEKEVCDTIKYIGGTCRNKPLRQSTSRKLKSG
ncbi:MAG: hypothetical protein DID90_2727554705 [Candidatus Nitrotoga sp. LAW]|nr:MAG: hypothetical protein DID90_2727554705 [Candidatus Nitrotoga sp. LAW]